MAKNQVNKGHKNIEGKGFDTHPENINKKGRPPKLLKHFNKEMKELGYERVTHTQVIEAYEHLFNLEEDKIKDLVNDKTQPMLLRITAKAMLSAKGTEMLEKMLDRGHGKAMQKVDLTSKGESVNSPIDFSKYSDEELRTIAELQRKGRVGPEESS